MGTTLSDTFLTSIPPEFILYQMERRQRVIKRSDRKLDYLQRLQISIVEEKASLYRTQARYKR